MSRPAVCYLERVAGGSLISRVRLVADGGPGNVIDRLWTAPSLPGAGAPSSSGDGAPGPDGMGASEAVGHTRAAARWIAESLSSLGGGGKRLAMLCVDPDGSVCTWLSAASPDPAVIQATLMQPDGDDSGMGGSGGGAARLLALGAGTSTGFNPGDASVQALATLDRPSERLLSRKTRTAPDAKRERFAVLAVPDAPVRVFLDELDSRGVEVDQVVSLWHALAMAWDPGAPGGQDAQDDGAGGGRVVSSVSPSAAIVAVDPVGRLVWAWSQSGQLVAGGAMRLRSVAPARPVKPAMSDALAAPDAARRIEPDSDEGMRLEFSPSDAGRLVLDWLSWSAQLGHCPQRVACIGPAPVGSGGGGGPAESTAPDPGLIGRSLGEAWPGTTVGVAIHDDPIGATLQRLLTSDIARENRAAGRDNNTSVATGSDDPRGAMVGLSSRAGRADRRMHTWVAIGVAGLAVLVGALGYKLHAAASDSAGAVTSANAERKTAIDGLKESIPQLAVSTSVKSDLESEVTRLTNQNNAIKPPRPVLQEMAALLKAISEQAVAVRENHDNAEIKIERFNLNPVTGMVDLRVPDSESGPAILEKLIKNPNLYIKWDGSTPGAMGSAPGERRFHLQGLPKSELRPAAGGGGS